MLAAEYPGARAMALSWLERHGTTHEDAEDIVQTAAVSALKNLAAFDGRSKFSTWFMQIVINARTMVYRRAHGKGRAMLYAEPLAETLPHRSNPEAECSRHERAQQIVNAALELPPCQRNAFLLHFCAEHTVADIARSQGVNITAVKSRSCHAVRHLQEKLCFSRPRLTPPRA
jgi:RNA polymerase sigma-70 factor (ECF subfamily)